MKYSSSIVILLVAIQSVSLADSPPSFPQEPTRRWVGTWSTAPQLVEPGNMPPTPGLANNSLRQVVRVSIGGDTIRVKFSNEFSADPVLMKSVQIAVSAGGSAIYDSTSEELMFNGAPEVTMSAGEAVTSDPIAFDLSSRMDVAITIYFGQTSSSVTGHPGSRTTSYIIAGNTTTVADFAGAVTTDHWYNINTIDVLAPSTAACVAILGNSITDGRGSTTNMQNRWPDVFSESLLDNPGTQNVGVLNMGIGGNAVISGGLGPTGTSRFDRDILEQSGLRWAVVFEGVNDIGGVRSAGAATTTANNLITAYKQMIAKAHARNIRIYGATILPFNGSSYYSQYSDQCRIAVNEWIRTGGYYDGVIDFDQAMRDPQDSTRLVSSYQNDGLHPDAAGYQTMGQFVDVSLFTGADTVFERGTDSESMWFEIERFLPPVSSFTVVGDGTASNGKYVTVQPGIQSLSAPPTDSAGLITVPFTVTTDTTYYIFARLNCPTADDDSYWVQVDDGAFTLRNGLVTSGWQWVTFVSAALTTGSHTLTIGYREDGAGLDKVCITNDEQIPTGLGEADSATLGLDAPETIDGYVLEQNYPNPFNPVTTITFSFPERSYVSLKVFDALGREVTSLVSRQMSAGAHRRQWDASGLASGVYFYRMQAGPFIETKKTILMR